MLDNVRSDLRAHGGRWSSQGFLALLAYRFGRWRYGIRSPWLRRPLSAVYHVQFKLVQIATGIELPCEVAIRRNFVIEHHGGIIVSGFASVGEKLPDSQWGWW